MKTYTNYGTYLKSVSRKPKWATVSVAAAAEVAHVTPHTIKNWLRDKKIKGVKVGSDTLVRADSLRQLVTEKRNRRKKIAKKVGRRLIELLAEGKTHVFYGELMAEFGYNSQRSPDRNEFGIIAGKVSQKSFNEMEEALGKGKGALLSSMIWRKDTEFVGEGYWGLFREDYEYDFGLTEPSDKDAVPFVMSQIELCRDFYT